MATPRSHALISPSSYERWAHCTAAPRYEEQFPEGEATSYALEGTLAHSVCELFGKKKFTPMSTRKFNSELKKLKENPLWKDEMERTAQFYVDFLVEKANTFDAHPVIQFELKVDLTDYIPDGFGSCDNVMIGGDVLRITDYKHGTGIKVSSINNGQMRLYALGALKYFYPIYGDTIKRICTAIVQPRITEEITEEWISVEDLRAWGESVKAKAQAAYMGLGTYEAGEWCKFCRGKAQCRARAEYYAGFSQFKDAEIEGRMTEADMLNREKADGFGVDVPPLLSDEEIGKLLYQAAELSDWYSDLQEYARDAILAGRTIPGWKVVAGKANRVLTDTDKALEIMRKEGFDDAVLYKREPLTLAQLEKLTGKTRFAEIMGKLIVHPKGKPTLVVESDERASYTPDAGPGEFAGVK